MESNVTSISGSKTTNQQLDMFYGQEDTPNGENLKLQTPLVDYISKERKEYMKEPNENK